MAQLINAAIQVIEKIATVAANKEKRLGSWYAPEKDVLDEAADKAEFYTKFLTTPPEPEFEMDLRKKAFMDSLSKESKKLRRKYKEMQKNPGVFSDDDIDAARDTYLNSLTEEQRQEEKHIKGAKIKETLFDLMAMADISTDDETMEIMKTQAAQGIKVSAAMHSEDKQAGMGAIFKRLHHLIDIPSFTSPVGRIQKEPGHENEWSISPNPVEEQQHKQYDWSRLTGLLKGQIAQELSDHTLWTKMEVSDKGRKQDAYYIEKTHGDKDSVAADVARYLADLPEMKGKIKVVYKSIDADGETLLGEREFDKAILKRNTKNRKKHPEEYQPTDYTGLIEGVYFIGPEAKKILSDWMGADVNAIDKANRRR